MNQQTLHKLLWSAGLPYIYFISKYFKSCMSESEIKAFRRGESQAIEKAKQCLKDNKKLMIFAIIWAVIIYPLVELFVSGLLSELSRESQKVLFLKLNAKLQTKVKSTLLKDYLDYLFNPRHGQFFTLLFSTVDVVGFESFKYVLTKLGLGTFVGVIFTVNEIHRIEEIFSSEERFEYLVNVVVKSLKKHGYIDDSITFSLHALADELKRDIDNLKEMLGAQKGEKTFKIKGKEVTKKVTLVDKKKLKDFEKLLKKRTLTSRVMANSKAFMSLVSVIVNVLSTVLYAKNKIVHGFLVSLVTFTLIVALVEGYAHHMKKNIARSFNKKS